MTTHEPSSVESNPIAWLIRIPIDPMTYRSLAYLLLAIPLGILYFALLVAGLSLSLGLLVLLIGPIVLVCTLLVIVAATWFDGLLTEIVLDVPVAPGVPSTASAKEFLTDLVLGADTWKGVVYLGWKAMLGFLALFLLVLGATISMSLLLAPLYYGDHYVVYMVGGHISIGTLPQALGIAVIGAITAYVTLLVVHLLGLLAATIAERMFPQP